MKVAITRATGFIGRHLVMSELQQSIHIAAVTLNKNHSLPEDNLYSLLPISIYATQRLRSGEVFNI